MPKKVPPGETPMPLITAGDWSVGFNTQSSLQQAELLTLLGRGLQRLYGDVVEEGVPEHLMPFVEQLGDQQHGEEG